ncbi:MAG: BREX system ATP-binding domain-containing protein [Thermoleophilia bacterium]
MNGRVSARRAIEALRAGVPNRDAVRALGCTDEEVLGVFDARLEDLRGSVLSESQPRGMLVAAEFGGGKSHVLEYLSHKARQENFAVSKVVISKETQLFDPLRVFRAAVESLVCENVVGDALRDIAVSRLSTKSPQFAQLNLWLRDSGLNSRFAATTWLFEQAESDSEMQDELVGFWEGTAIEVGRLRQGLRQVNAAKLFSLEKISIKELARQRFTFMARLLRAARYDGWVIFLDELEMMGHYTVLQRGRAYAELARMLGLAEDLAIPGLLAVGAVTMEYAPFVIDGKDDRNQIGFKFRPRGDLESNLTAALAESAMDTLERGLLRLREPSQADLANVLARLSDIYATAYDCTPAGLDASFRTGQNMREYIRSWITTWDLNRVAPSYEPEIELERITEDYAEDALLEQGVEDDEPGDQAATQ